MPLSAKHLGAQRGVCKPAGAFSGHLGVGGALTATWDGIVGGKCSGPVVLVQDPRGQLRCGVSGEEREGETWLELL